MSKKKRGRGKRRRWGWRSFLFIAAGATISGVFGPSLIGSNENGNLAQPAPAGDALTTGTLALPITAPDPNRVILTPLATLARALGQVEVRIEIAEKALGELYQQRERLMIEMRKVD